ncbi:MAG: Tfx family DNA-binding protein [Thermoprotei archaeon]
MKYGFLTLSQVRVLKYRILGYSLRETASKLGVSHQTVAVIEKRALENIRRAETTLLVYNLLSSKVKLIIRPGTKLVEIPSILVREADKKNVKIRGDFTLIYKLLRYRAGNCISNGRVVKPVLVLVTREGLVEIYPFKEIRSIYEEIERIG